ncbi:MAG: hypothetical protein U5J98_11195 [Halobacteriales archaeon]|nr:hypothetical protein [Halobacteriales archaeon]
MPPFTTRLAEGWDRALDHLALALVPVATALLATDKIGAIASFRGGHVGLRLGLPVGIVDLWQFVSLPNSSMTIGLPLPEALPLAVVVVPLGILLQAALSAGYFGSLESALRTGEFEFIVEVRRSFWPFLLYTVVPMVVALPLALLGLADSRGLLPLLVVLVPVFLIAAYLFYATPYLIVLRDLDLLPAARRSYALASEGGPYLRFAGGYAGFVLAVSLVTTAVVVNLGLAGVAIGVVALAPVGLAANATAMRFVADLDDRSPSLGGWPDGPADGASHDDDPALAPEP